MPARWFWPYVEMLTRLDAEQALARISQVAAATPHAMADADRRSYHGELRRAAASPHQRPHKATLADMAGVGITIAAPGGDGEK